MADKSSKKELKILGSYLIIGFIIFIVIMHFFEENDVIITGFFSLLTVTIPLLIREYYASKKEDKVQRGGEDIIRNDKEIPLSSKDTFDVFLFGHSGSGKTTFIQRLFTFDTSPLKSTKEFDYYSVEVPIKLKHLNKNHTINVKIADYKGQDVTQLFEAARKNYFIDSIIFFADVAPCYDDNGRKLNLEDVLDLMSNNFEEQLFKRINVHRYKYLSEFLMQAVFTYASSDYLKSVRLVINKFDILETLQDRGVIDPTIDLENYVKNLFKEPIFHLQKFCKKNEIEDFKTVVVSAAKSYNTRETFTDILNRYVY